MYKRDVVLLLSAHRPGLYIGIYIYIYLCNRRRYNGLNMTLAGFSPCPRRYNNVYIYDSDAYIMNIVRRFRNSRSLCTDYVYSVRLRLDAGDAHCVRFN